MLIVKYSKYIYYLITFYFIYQKSNLYNICIYTYDLQIKKILMFIRPKLNTYTLF